MIHLICGYMRQDHGPADPKILERMGQAMVRKGYEHGFDCATDGVAGLAVVGVHKPGPLAKPEDSPPPPTLLNTADLIIAADMRLYNRDKIIKRFPQTDTDTSLIAALYRADGPRGLDQLEGDFTLAVWDKAARQMLFKRDHIGVRPAYYAHKPGQAFVFASLGKGVRASGLIPTPKDIDACIDNIFDNDSDQVFTFHTNLLRLPGGHEAIATPTQFKTNQYWCLKRQSYPPENVTFEEWTAGLKARFKAAVTKRLPPSGPISSHLSSGMDSASITAVAAQNLPDEDQILDTYTFAMSSEFSEEDMLDETPHARKVAMQTNRIAWTKLHVDDKAGKRCKADMEYEEDRDSMKLPHGLEERVARGACEKGSSVILSGWGGDEIATYTGSGALAELLWRGKFATFARETRLHSMRKKQPLSNMLIESIGARFAPQVITNLVKRLAGHSRDFSALQRQRSGLKGSALSKKRRPSRYDGANSQKNRLGKFYNGNLHWRLEDWAYTGADHGVQYAFPMLDIPFLEYALACPPHFLIHDGYNRAGFRAAMKNILPDEIRLNRWKHVPTPCASIRVIRNKENFLDELDALEKDPDLRAAFDFKGIRRRLKNLPSEAEERKKLAEWAKIGEQGYNYAPSVVRPISNMKRYQVLLAEKRAQQEAAKKNPDQNDNRDTATEDTSKADT